MPDVFDKQWNDRINPGVKGKMFGGGPAENLSESRDYLDFCAKPSLELLVPYYEKMADTPEAKQCAELRPSNVIKFANEKLNMP